MSKSNEQGTGDKGPKKLPQAVVDHQSAITRACRKLFGDAGELEETVGEVTVRLLRKQLTYVPDNWEDWLFVAALRLAKTIWREKAKECHEQLTDSLGDILSDRANDFETSLATQQLFRGMKEFLSDAEWCRVELLRDVALEVTTRAILAEKLGRSRQQIRTMLANASRLAREAANAAYLVYDRDKHACPEPSNIVSRWKNSPESLDRSELLKKIKTHVDRCRACSVKWRDVRRIRNDFRASSIPAIAVGSSLVATSQKWVSIKKIIAGVAATAGVALVVAGITPGQDTTGREHPQGPPSPRPARTRETAPPSRPSTSSPGPGSELATTSHDLPYAPGTPATSIPLPPSPPAPDPSYTPPTATIPAPVDGGRNGGEPIVMGSWIQHPQIATAEWGDCGHDPIMSEVQATVRGPGGVQSVFVHLRHGDRDIAVPMTQDGPSSWRTLVGRLSGDHVEGRYDLVVEATSANGTVTETAIGVICVVRCRVTSLDEADGETK
jgi:DNA-directed RNA polymerase specialized sigma24 family protein